MFLYLHKHITDFCYIAIALPPSEPRLMVNSDFEQNEFYLNISWKGPFYPQGIIKEYLIVINSDSNSVFIDEKIEVEVSIRGLHTYMHTHLFINRKLV